MKTSEAIEIFHRMGFYNLADYLREKKEETQHEPTPDIMQ